MENIKEFYSADIEKLKKFRSDLMDESIIKSNGIIRQIALDRFVAMIDKYLIRLGVEED